MQSDENSIKETKKDVVLSSMKPEKIEYGVVYSSEKYQEDFIVKPIKATKQTIDVPFLDDNALNRLLEETFQINF